MGRVFNALAADDSGSTIKVGKLKIDEDPVSARGFGITSIPALPLLQGGETVESLIGVQSKQNYRQVLEQAAV